MRTELKMFNVHKSLLISFNKFKIKKVDVGGQHKLNVAWPADNINTYLYIYVVPF